MRIECPHCKAVYQVDQPEPDTVFVCYRCDTEFGFGKPPEDAEALKEPAGTAEPTAAPRPEEPRPELEADTAPQSAPPSSAAETSPPETIAKPQETEQVPQAAETPDNVAPVTPDAEPARQPEPEATSSEAAPVETAPEPEPTPEPSPAPEPEAPEPTPEPEKAPEPEPEEPAPTEEEVVEEEIEEIIPEPAPEPEPVPEAPRAEKREPAPKKSKSGKAKKERVASPRRKSVNIWPWLFAILLILAGAGLWFTHDIWLNNVWVRSKLISIGLPISANDKDWKIIPGSIRAKWVTRSDKSHVLVISGTVENTLECKLPLPSIRVKLYAQDAPTLVIETRVIPITQLPLPVTIKRAPYLTPPIDTVPVAAKGDRSFELVLETLPKRVGDFSLSPVVKK